MNDQFLFNGLDIFDIADAMLKRWWLILLCMIIGGVAGFGYAYYNLTPTYKTGAQFYVNGGNGVDVAGIKVTSNELSSSSSKISTYGAILKTRNTLNEVIKRADLDLSYEALKSMISCASVDETLIFDVSVVDSDPVRAARIANTITEVLPEKIGEIISGSSACVVDYAIIPTTKLGPNLTRYAEYGILAGALLAAGIILVLLLSDDKIHNEDYLLANYPNIPLLGVIPDFAEVGTLRKGKKYSSYYSTKYYYDTEHAEELSADQKKKKKKAAAKSRKAKKS